MPSHNKQFGAMAAEVIIHTAVIRETVSDSPSGIQLNPPLRQAATSL